MPEKKYSVLVVDDEQWIREGLKSKLKKLPFPLASVREASCGAQALREMEEEACDIVITDICMADMDGLKLLESLSESYPKTQKIILSGYGEFDYAVKGLREGAVQYLLKPIDVAELQEALARCVKRLETLHEKQEAAQNAREDVFTLSENYRAVLSCDALLGKHLTLYRPDHTAWAGAAFYLGDASGLPPVRAIVVFEKEEPSFSWGRDTLLLKTGFQEYAVLWCAQENDETLRVRACHAVKAILRRFSLEAPHGACAGLGFHEKSAYDCLLHAQFLLHHRVLYPEKELLLEEDANRLTQDYTLSSVDSIACRYFIRAGKFHEFADLLKRIGVCLEDGVRYSQAQAVYDKLCGLIRDNTNHGDAGSDEEPRPFWKYSSLRSALHGIREYYLQRVNLTDLERTAREALVLGVRDYIDENFDQQLSLELLARIFATTPTYLSSLFKEVLGVNYQEYLIERRIRAAKELMQENRYKLRTVAEIVGFNDQHYFSKVFKKLEGVSPREYQAGPR